MFRPSSDLDPSPETAPDPDPTPAAQKTSARRPRQTFPPIPRRTAAIGMTALGIVSILTGMLAAAMQPQPAPETAGASARPSIAVPARPSASPTPTPVDTAFHPIEGTAARPIARLSAIGAAGAVVPLDASFRLETASETPVAELVRRLTIEPATAVSSRTDGAAVVLTPKSPLRPGAVYRFALHGAGGELLDTWAFQAKQPVRIVGTLPGDRQADIPLDTGIEVTFDQDGVVDAAAHVTIDPATAGRFEMHGRTLAFVPNRPLKRSTLYTVTVSPGIVAATGEATATETRFQFETGIAGGDTDPLTFTFNDVLAESPTDERPVIGIWAFGGDRDRMPKSIHLAVYRLANLDAGIAAWRTLRARPSWTRWSTTGLVDPSGLQRVVAAELPLRSMENAWFVELPERLPVGWYLVAQNDGARPAQQVLQVSDVSGYLAVSETRTVVWANDIKTRRPIAGATASAGSERLGRTDARGLINARTPGGLVPEAGSRCTTPCDPVVIVRAPDGRSIFLPAAAGSDRLFDGGGYFYWDSDPGWWSLLHVDRVRYRVGDTINVWGMARDRDTGSVPAHVRLSVTPAESETADGPPLASTVLSTRSTGAFSGSISLAGLPEGGYVVSLAIGDRTLRSTWFSIGVIAKPAYTLSASTARRIYLAGERVTVRVDARFYEGTPVPGVPVQFEGTVDGSATTTSDGIARRSGIAAAGEGGFEPDMQTIDVHPARAEEGEIGGATAAIFVFPGSRTIDSTARIADGRVRVSGTVHLVARNRLERALADGAEFWDLDPRGAPVANATVTVRFVERIPVRTQTGTQYDFIEKKVVPVYEVDVRELAAGTIRVRTDAKGRWSASIPATPTDHDYSVTAAVGDPAGRIARADAFAARRTDVSDLFSTSASLRLTAGDPDNAKTFRVGDEIDVTMTDPNLAQTPGDGTSYLFFTAQRGIHDATVGPSRRYRFAFPRWGVPNFSVAAVRFTGRIYVGATWYEPAFRVSDRRLDIELTADSARYAPGESATVRVRTTVAGSPVSATVVLRAVDEKLYTIGAAVGDDPLTELYSWVPNGIDSTYQSHELPRNQWEGGDTTGGGGDDGRADFRDFLFFKTITTGADGRGEVSFALSDDLTSWRVTGSGVTRRLEAGVASIGVPVGLPFFVDASIAPEYLATDRPAIPVRAYGTALAAGQAVTIRVTSRSLGFDSGEIRSTAFATATVPLPALRAGVQTVTISATTGTGDARRTDRMTRTFVVSASRLTTLQTASVDLPSGGPFPGAAAGFTTVVVSDAAAGRYDALLAELAEGGGARLDRALAAAIARSILDRRTAAPSDPGPAAFDAERYVAPDGGLALVPYASSDLELSAYAALVAPDRVDGASRVAYFTRIHADPKETRERRSLALVGLAGLGEPVLPALRAAIATPDLTIREQLVLGLAAASVGDAATARSILATLVGTYGERAGDLARLRVGSTADDITEATALSAFLAAKLGDPLAPAFWAYTAANPARDRIEALTGIGFVEAMLGHLAATSSSFAWTIAGERHTVHLDRGEGFRIVVTPDQLRSLTIEPLTGQVRVTTAWREPLGTAALPVDPDLTITRTVQPGSSMRSSDLAVVELRVRFGPAAAAGCREVTELVPSGLAPVGASARWYEPDEGDEPPDETVILPYAQDGQRVSFCVGPTERHRTFTLRYVARVVTAGTYSWEPAIAQDPSGQGPAAMTEASSISIR